MRLLITLYFITLISMGPSTSAIASFQIPQHLVKLQLLCVHLCILAWHVRSLATFSGRNFGQQPFRVEVLGHGTGTKDTATVLERVVVLVQRLI